jgi:hypothetical protein
VHSEFVLPPPNQQGDCVLAEDELRYALKIGFVAVILRVTSVVFQRHRVVGIVLMPARAMVDSTQALVSAPIICHELHETKLAMN